MLLAINFVFVSYDYCAHKAVDILELVYSFFGFPFWSLSSPLISLNLANLGGRVQEHS